MILITCNYSVTGPFVRTSVSCGDGRTIRIAAQAGSGRIASIALEGSDFSHARLDHSYHALIAFAQHILCLEHKLDKDVTPIEIRHFAPSRLLPDEHYEFIVPRCDCRQTCEYTLFTNSTYDSDASPYVIDTLARHILKMEPENIKEV